MPAASPWGGRGGCSVGARVADGLSPANWAASPPSPRTSGRHPASLIPFDELKQQLDFAVAEGLVFRKESPRIPGAYLYCYSKECVFNGDWNLITESARGLILFPEEKRIVFAFPKFFNYGERGTSFLPEPYEIFEKLDGSLIIAFYYSGRWRCATKGSFDSDQAIAAENLLNLNPPALDRNYSYLFELIGPSNKIVIKYPQDKLVLLGAYDDLGRELLREWLVGFAFDNGFSIAKRISRNSLNELLEDAKSLPASEEGWVIRFESGYRIKIKGEEYRRIHRAISRLSPLFIWECMRDEKDLIEIKKEIPEEFWEDFDRIYFLLNRRLDRLLREIEFLQEKYSSLSDRELGMLLQGRGFQSDGERMLFAARKGWNLLENPKSKSGIFQIIRPTGNVLEDYSPSWHLMSVQNEEG